MIPLSQARDVGAKFLKLIEPAVEASEIGGSVRRGAAQVKDLEIVCKPWMAPEPGTLIEGEPVSALDDHIERLVKNATPLTFNQENKKNGSKYKTLIWGGSLKIDLFCVLPPATWGAILAIRTGPGDFNKLLVTRRCYGGALPDQAIMRDGVLYDGHGLPIDTPTERDFFAALGVPFWAPGERTEERLQKYLLAERKKLVEG